MPHISHDDLAWLAAQDDDTALHDAHLRTCATCQQELAGLRRTVDRIRADAVEPVAVPTGLWDKIAAEIAEPANEAAPTSERATDQAGAVPPRHAVPNPAPNGSRRSTAPPPTPTSTGPRRTRRRTRHRTMLALLTAAAVLVGVGVGVWAFARPTTTVLASVPLDRLSNDVGRASAEIIERDGHRVLVIDAAQVPSVPDASLDVWLIDPDIVGMVNVGLLDADSHEYVLPDDLDLEEYPIIDVSVEPLDGDPTHSGVSVWRGLIS